MISLRNGLIRNFLRIIFQFAYLLVKFEHFFQRRRSIPQLSGDPASYETLKPSLETFYKRMEGKKFWAKTSGTKKEPKLLPYDKKRTKTVQLVFMKAMITLTGPYKGKKTFFVFSSLNDDASLTSGLLDSGTKPGLVALLQAPYRYLQTKDGQLLRKECGDLAARMALLIVTQPQFLYATNPSTLTHFLSQYETNWPEVRAALKNLRLKPHLMKSLLTLSDGSALKRLNVLLEFSRPPKLKEILPELKAIISWDGGYVGVFVEQLKQKLPDVDFVPMFSMSTEGLQTIPHRINGKIHFLPTAPKTYSEFIDLKTQKILQAKELRAGEEYSLLLSDEWGLNRYDTQDIFYVQEMVKGLPDLRFKRRRGMTSSLTGEKLTEGHILLLTSELKKIFPYLEHASISLYPVQKGENFGYEMAIIGTNHTCLTTLSLKSEGLLQSLNTEYASKVESGRLLPLSIHFSTAAELAALMGNKDQWESQFKILPLYEKILKKN